MSMRRRRWRGSGGNPPPAGVPFPSEVCCGGNSVTYELVGLLATLSQPPVTAWPSATGSGKLVDRDNVGSIPPAPPDPCHVPPQLTVTVTWYADPGRPAEDRV
jgi:hypothetical protein